MNTTPVVTILCVCAAYLSIGCGRDALVLPKTSAEPPGVILECPGRNDGVEEGFNVSPQGLSVTPTAPASCSFEGARGATPATNMSMLVRLILGFEDVRVASELMAQGLAAEDASDRETIIKRLLTEKASGDLSDQWLSAWLEIPKTTPFADRFSASLWQDLTTQTLRHGRAVFIEGIMPIDSLVTSRSSFANASLGKYYGVSVPTSNAFQTVQLPSQRVGVLSHGAVLGAHPSVTSRGDLLLKSFMQCQSAPPPPQGILPHDMPHTTLVARKQLQRQLDAPVCRGCHSMLDAGFLLHGFDERGAVRSKDTDGAALDTRIEIFSLDGNPATADDLPSFGAHIAEDGSWKACLAQQLIDIAAARTKRELLTDPTDPCGPPMVMARQLAKTPLMFETMKLLSAIVVGGRVSNGQVNDLPAPPAAPSLGIDGILSPCTRVDSQSVSCRAICKSQSQACTKEICRLDGTLGQAFTFTDRDHCESDSFETVESQSCDQLLNAQACRAAPVPLRWVRCCCE